MNILAVVDIPNWAFDITFKDLRDQLTNEYSIAMDYKDWLGRRPPGVSYPYADYDKVITSTTRLKIDYPKSVYSTGICSYFWDYTKEAPPSDDIVKDAKQFKSIYVPSKSLYNHLASKDLDNIYYTPSGVDQNIFYPQKHLRPKVFTAGWVGNSNRTVKQIDVIKNACHKANVELKLCEFGKPSRIKDRKMMAEYYNSLSIYINASTSEGELKTIKEAMSCGVPVICTPVGCTPELIVQGETGFVFNNGAQELTERLLYLKRNPSILSNMGDNALEQSKMFWWPNVLDYWREFFNG